MPARRLGRLGQCIAEQRGSADHRVKIEMAFHFFGQRGEFVARGFAVGGVAQCLHQPVRRDRLDQIIGRARPHRFHREQRRGAGGDHQDRQRGAAFFQFGNEFARLIAGNPLVQNDRGKLHPLPRAERGDGFFAIIHHQHAPAFTRGKRADQPALRRLIIDQHQQPLFGFGHACFTVLRAGPQTGHEGVP